MTENLTEPKAESGRHQILDFVFHGLCYWPVTACLRKFINSFISSVDRSLQSWVLLQNDKIDRKVGTWKPLHDTLLITYPGCREQQEHLDEPWRVEVQSYEENPKAFSRPYQNFSVWFPVSIERQFVLFIDKDIRIARNGGQSKDNKKVYINVPLGDLVYFSTFIRHAGAPANEADTNAKRLNFGIHRYVDFVTGKLALDRARTRTRVGIDLDKNTTN
jgi:hypothetical protein